MSIDDGSIKSHQFVATGSAYGSAWEKSSGPNARKYWRVGFFVIVGFLTVTMLGPTLGLPLPILAPFVTFGFFGVVVVLGVVSNTSVWRRSRRTYVIEVSGDGIIIDGRREAVYSFADAQLGLWVRSGLALQLYSGPHQFRLGGQGRLIGPGTPLDGPPVQCVDAWLHEADFDKLLSLSGRWNGSATEAPSAGEPTRCLLYPNALQMQAMGPFAFGKRQRLQQSLAQPQLFIDVDEESIRLIDANDNTQIAAAPLSGLNASPATYELGGRHRIPSLRNLATDAVAQYYSRSAAMSVCVPGVPPLTVGCRGFTGMFTRRFSWSRDVPVVNAPPEYEVSIADWLVLVEKLGLAPLLEDTAS